MDRFNTSDNAERFVASHAKSNRARVPRFHDWDKYYFAAFFGALVAFAAAAGLGWIP